MVASFIDLISKRVSYPRLVGPAPNDDLLERIYRSALRAPDHMMLRPWRYLLIKDDARNTLGDVFCDAALKDDTHLTAAQKEKYRVMPLRAPMMIVGISTNQEHPKVPVEEQVISCGVGIGYMLLALQSEGFGGIWRTGPLAHNAYVREALGIQEHETLVGFLYLGTPQGEAKPIPDTSVDNYFTEWNSSLK
jgi:nitroreductase